MLDKINIDILKNITLISFVVVLFCLNCFAIIKNPEPIFIAVVFLIMCIAFVILLICCLLFLCIILDNGIEELYYIFPKNKLKRAIRGY